MLELEAYRASSPCRRRSPSGRTRRGDARR